MFPILKGTESISDLEPTSRLLESLNEDFPRVADKVEIRSFFEMEKSKVLTKIDYVVPKHSALLNHKNELWYGLGADHRGMCKYDKPTDPNYEIMRNALSATVDKFVKDYNNRNEAASNKILRSLRDFFGIPGPPEDEFEHHYYSCLTGKSCTWFTSGAPYRTWRDSNYHSETNAGSLIPGIFLIEADPGAGKSVLAAQVINNLRSLSYGCSYYFFDSQNRQTSSFSYLIRSLALQMALISPAIRQSMLALCQNHAPVSDDSDISIWRNIFMNSIFKHRIDQHYWVIDGLDECKQADVILEKFSNAFKTDPNIRLRILITTRPGEVPEEKLSTSKVTRLRLSKIDTLDSMRTYVEERMRHSRLSKQKDKDAIARSILDNADGSFLWVKLVLDDIMKATGQRQIQSAIENIPKGMDHLYAGIVVGLRHEIPQEDMPMLKAFLEWTLFTNPPLTVEELEAALGLKKFGNFIVKMCEQTRNLIIIDHHNKVRAVHKTARTFLMTSGIDSEFVISSNDAHTRIASLLVERLRSCLGTIQGEAVLKGWYNEKKTGLDNYALLYFSEHIRRTPPDNHEVFEGVAEFFNKCGKTWIATVAISGSLSPLVKASQNLRHWLQARAKSTPPLGELAGKTAQLQQWAVDLVRLVAKFGRHLLEFPGAMYQLVPSFVPQESILSASKMRLKPTATTVTGLTNERWDDRLCSMFYQGSTCTAVASGAYSFAVALRKGIVHIYDNSTLQISATLQHDTPVKLLKYDETGLMLLSVGHHEARMWLAAEGTQMWKVAVPRFQSWVAAEFIEENRTLISISSEHKLTKRETATGKEIVLKESNTSLGSEEEEETFLGFRRELQYAEFSAEADMLATMQRERPIQITDIEARFDIGKIELEMSNDGEYNTVEQPITTMTFCANIDVALLAAAYRDGTLAVFGRDLGVIAKRGDSRAISLLAGSPDGLTLAAATVEGVVTLYDFEQLIPLHILFTSSIENIRSLVFSGDGQRIIDIRDRQANVWAPAALVTRVREDSDSISESTLSPTIVTSDWTGLKDGIVEITAVRSIKNSNQFFCGREDGSITIHNTRSPSQQDLLYVDPNKLIGKLVWESKPRVLASVSGTSTLTVFVLGAEWSIRTTLLRHTFLHPVLQILFQDTAEFLRMVVVTTKTVGLWLTKCPLTDQSTLAETTTKPFDTGGMFIEDARDSIVACQYLTLVEPERLRNYSWQDLEDVGSRKTFSFSQTAGPSQKVSSQIHQERITAFDRAARLSAGGHNILLRSVSSRETALSTSTAVPAKVVSRKRWILDIAQTNFPGSLAEPIGTPSTATQASLLPISHLIEHVIGIKDQTNELVFLSKALWVCSYDLGPPPNARKPSFGRSPSRGRGGNGIKYKRHLFIPDDWISSNYSNATSELLFVLGGPKDDCLIFVKKHEVAVIKSPFSHVELVQVS